MQTPPIRGGHRKVVRIGGNGHHHLVVLTRSEKGPHYKGKQIVGPAADGNVFVGVHIQAVHPFDALCHLAAKLGVADGKV